MRTQRVNLHGREFPMLFARAKALTGKDAATVLAALERAKVTADAIRDGKPTECRWPLVYENAKADLESLEVDLGKRAPSSEIEREARGMQLAAEGIARALGEAS